MTDSLKPVAALAHQCVWMCETVCCSSNAPFISRFRQQLQQRYVQFLLYILILC